MEKDIIYYNKKLAIYVCQALGGGGIEVNLMIGEIAIMIIHF